MPLQRGGRAALTCLDGTPSSIIAAWLKEGYDVREKIQQALGNKAAAESDRTKAGQLTSHIDF